VWGWDSVYDTYIASIGNVPAAKRIRIALREVQTHCEGARKVEGVRSLGFFLWKEVVRARVSKPHLRCPVSPK